MSQSDNNTNGELFDNKTNDIDVDEATIDYVKYYTRGDKAPTLEEMAKRKYDADAHIARLEEEQRQLRNDLNSQLSIQKLLERLDKQTPSNTNQNSASNNEQSLVSEQPKQNTTTTPSAPDFEKMVQEVLNKENVKRKATENIKVVKDTMRKAWGPNYERMMLNKAEELGASKDFLEGLASSNPRAYFKLMEVNPDTLPAINPSLGLPPRTNTNTTSSAMRGDAPVKNYSYYKDLRSKDPQTYYDPKTQMEMHSNAAKMLDDFYK